MIGWSNGNEMKEYLKEFEKEVLIKLFESTKRNAEPVPLKKRKIHLTEFGSFIESSFKYNQVLAFDYYGLFKVSKKILSIRAEHISIFPSIKIINAPVIHFSSVKKEQIQQLAPHLLKDFNQFKKYLVNLRWKGGYFETAFYC